MREKNMPVENTELMKVWKIEYVVDWGAVLIGHEVAKPTFKVTPPFGKSSVLITVIFSRGLIGDLFEFNGINGIREDIIKKAKKEESLLKKCGLVKIEELIDADSIKGNQEFKIDNLSWVQKIKEGQLIPTSEIQNENIFMHTPESKTKIGFYPIREKGI